MNCSCKQSGLLSLERFYRENLRVVISLLIFPQFSLHFHWRNRFLFTHHAQIWSNPLINEELLTGLLPPLSTSIEDDSSKLKVTYSSYNFSNDSRTFFIFSLATCSCLCIKGNVYQQCEI